jgi:hypothetical protein
VTRQGEYAYPPLYATQIWPSFLAFLYCSIVISLVTASGSGHAMLCFSDVSLPSCTCGTGRAQGKS